MDLTRLVDRLTELPGQAIYYYDRAALVRKPYPELFADVKRFEGRLRASGVGPGMHVGLLAENSYEWIACELALLRMNCVSVCFSPEEFANSALEELADKYRLGLLAASPREIERRGEGRDWVMSLTADGRDARARPTHADWSLDADVFTLVFSSGTSGKLKCLLISRRGTEELIENFGGLYQFRPDDAILMFLPLSIFQQRWMIYTAIRYGFDLHLAEPARLFKALKEMRPTIIGAPPLFYEVFEKRFRALPASKRVPLSVAGRFLSLLVSGPLRSALARKIFAPFHEALGGRTRLMLTGAAPTRRSTLECFSLLGLPLFEGYGLTETGYISLNLPGRNRVGSVGRPVTRGSVSIAPDGEIVFSSNHPLSRGYLFCDEQEQRQTYLDASRIATGDIGRFDEDGYLHLTGRKKEIIITQGGYKVHPESLEREIERAPEVSRAVVFGGGELTGLAALVALPARDPSAEQRVRASVDRLNEQLPPPTRVGRLVFAATEFTTENGFLNRNLKVDRRAVFAAYRRELSGLE
jgi:long-subunit acyl-CoA synthetase (AMP-forming)